ncbi:MAG: hypothetical protein ACK5C3_00045 [bacterium]
MAHLGHSGRAGLCSTIVVIASVSMRAIAATPPMPEPVKDVTDEPVVEGTCGWWTEQPLSPAYIGTPYDGELEFLNGFQECSNLPCSHQGIVRKSWIDHSQFVASNTLWFFNPSHGQIPPQPGVINNLGIDSVYTGEKVLPADGRWTREYTYAPGTGSLAGVGNKALLRIKAEGKVDIALNRMEPECASGACSKGEGLHRYSFAIENLLPLTGDMCEYLERRDAEDDFQDWYCSTCPGNVPETLRRMSRLRTIWCRGTSGTGWQGGVTLWPIGGSWGSSGPDNLGEVLQVDTKTYINRKIPVCLRAPYVAPGQTASFELQLDAELEARTELSGACYSRVISSVKLQTLDMAFSSGCEDCPVEGDVSLEQQGGQTGAG